MVRKRLGIHVIEIMLICVIPRLVMIISLVLETSVVLHFENYMPYSSIMI